MRLGIVLALLVCINGIYATCAPSDVAALVALFNATDGPNWNDVRGWGTDSDPCCGRACNGVAWMGVNCSGASSDPAQRVIGLSLPGAGLSGSVPTALLGATQLQNINFSTNPGLRVSLNMLANGTLDLVTLDLSYVGSLVEWPASFGALPNLVSLDLSENSLAGAIPSSIGLLSSLQELNLESMGLLGTIPASIGNLTQLLFLRLVANTLSGTVPESLCNLTNLTTLSFSANMLTGTLPQCVGNFTQLTYLDASFNQFYGEVPWLWEMTSLTFVDLQINHFSGTLPALNMPRLTTLGLVLNDFSGTLPSFAGLPMLEALSLDNNLFRGEFPSSVCDLPLLDSLTMTNLDLEGEFPECITGMTQLEAFAIGGPSQMNGTLPQAICQMKSLVGFEIANIAITGTLPDCLGSLPNLTQLALLSTNISGTIPASLFASPKITDLELISNNFTGTIPEVPANSKLRTLRLPDNRLSGTIPAVFAQLPSLEVLDLSHNQLVGVLPMDWQLTTSTLQVLALGGNAGLTFHGPGGLTIPMLWAIDQFCNIYGHITYLDISEVDASGISLDEILLSAVGGYPYFSSCAGRASLPLGVLRASAMGISSLSAYILVVLGSLVVMDISDNNIQGPLPFAYIPPLLVTWDLSDNNFTGAIPAVFDNDLTTTLQSLDLSGNPYLGFPTDGCAPEWPLCLPPFLAANLEESTQLPDVNGSCFGVTDALSHTAVITVDPSFHNYQLCRCITNFFGHPKYKCSPTGDLCTGGTCVVQTEGIGNATLLLPNYYPSVDQSNVLKFLPCRISESMTYSYGDACNASQLTCYTYPNSSLVCFGEPCNPGHEGRLCSRCNSSYYAISAFECTPCPVDSDYMSAFIAYAVTAAGAIVVFVLLLTNIGKVPRTDSSFVWKLWLRHFGYILLSAGIIISTNITAVWEAYLTVGMLICALIALCVQEMYAGDADIHAPRFLQTPLLPLIIGLFKSQVIFTQTLFSIGGLTFTGGGASSLLQTLTYDNPIVCLFPSLNNPYSQLISSLVSAHAVAVFIAVWVGIQCLFVLYSTRCWRGPTSRQKFRHTARTKVQIGVSVVIFYCNMVFFQMNTYFWSYFTCAEDPTFPDSTDYMYNVMQPNLACYTSEYWFNGAIGIALFGTYMLVALTVVVNVASVRRRLKDENVKEYYGFFYESYKLKHWYFDIVVLARRGLVSTLAAVLVTNIGGSAFWILFVLLAAQWVQISLMPFRQRIVNVAECLSLFCLVLVACSYGFNVMTDSLSVANGGAAPPNPQSTMSGMFSIVVISAVLCVYAAGFLAMVLATLTTYCCPRRRMCGRGCWSALDYWLAPEDEEDDVAAPPLVGRVNERTPLVSKNVQHAAAVSPNTELAEMTQMYVEDASITRLLRTAMSFPVGSEEREAAIITAFRDVSIASGLRQRNRDSMS